MIRKINKIDNLGLVFPHYLRDSQLPSFSRYNLIYGFNFTGKTTLSRLFEAIENGSSDQIPNLGYEVEDEAGAKYKQGQPFNKKIRVFNQDYIENNIKILECKAKAITLILGDVNKEIVNQIEKDQKNLVDKEAKLKELTESLDRKNKDKDKTFTDIAKTIYVAITGGAIRNYRKNDAEADFGRLASKDILAEAELSKLSIVVKQNSKPTIEEVKIGPVGLTKGGEESLTGAINYLMDQAKLLLAKTVESQIIEKLKDNRDISDWVETGLNLHSLHPSPICEFCGQVLPETRLKELARHFSDADRALKKELDNLLVDISRITSTVNSVGFPDYARFYDETQADYQSDLKSFIELRDDLVKSLNAAKELVEAKKTKTTEPTSFDLEIGTKPLIDSFIKITGLIERHNNKTTAFEDERSGAIKKLNNHYLSTIFDEVKILEGEIENIKKQIGELNNGELLGVDDLGILSLKKRIVENQAKISSTLKACEEINNGLKTFLGRDELEFGPHKSKILDENGVEQEIEDGYVIKRNGKLANYLSEGEKTAIAFVYFMIHLGDQNFDINKGVVVIDDPVSSLDSNSLFQAFSFLKNSVLPAEQVFILTHNFDFLRLIINWMGKVKNHGYFMVKNKIDANGLRVAYLDKLDQLLERYETEYQYLFSLLKNYQSDQSLEKVYPIPNIARKFLDTFLAFRVPNSNSFYDKLEKINYDQVKKNAIFKFTNHECHITGKGFDPALIPEADKVIPDLLDMVKQDSGEHYKILEESFSTT